MSPSQVEELAIILRERHPDLDPLELDPTHVEALVAELPAGEDLAPVLVAWEQLLL